MTRPTPEEYRAAMVALIGTVEGRVIAAEVRAMREELRVTCISLESERETVRMYRALADRVEALCHMQHEDSAVSVGDIRAASVFADRAHGPLEAKTVPLKTLAVCSEVDALVKAARAACDLALPDSVGYDLTLALERFETERGE